jgi:hypothetical protein
MSGPMVIEQLSCQRYTPGETVEGTFYDFDIYLGLTDEDALGSTFESNWLPGTRQLVLHRDSMTISNSPEDWVQFPLDQAFWYNGEDNLLVEIMWSSAYTDDSCMYTWHWNTGSIRSINGGYSDPTGTMGSLLIMFMFQGQLSCVPDTFAGVKTAFGP